MSKTTDALEDLVPFAEAVLELRDLNKEKLATQHQIDLAQSRLDAIKDETANRIRERDKAIADSASARTSEAAAKRGITEANTEREAIIALAKTDAQTAYNAQLTVKNESFGAIDRKIAAAAAKLTETERAILAAQDRLAEIERQITTLKSQFS